MTSQESQEIATTAWRYDLLMPTYTLAAGAVQLPLCLVQALPLDEAVAGGTCENQKN